MFTTNKNMREERMLELLIKKLRRSLSLLQSRKSLDLNGVKYNEAFEAANLVPDDVKEGHFAVLAMEGGEPKRFIVELCYLSSPAFLSLLKQAEDEYGFQQTGAIAVPCRPEELQKILEDKRKKSNATTHHIMSVARRMNLWLAMYFSIA